MTGFCRLDCFYDYGLHHYDAMRWLYFPPHLSSTPEPQDAGRSKNRKHLRGRMKGTWQEDGNFCDKHFPPAQGSLYITAIKKSLYNETAKRWKRITTKPKSASSLVVPLRNLLNTILERSGIPATQRMFLKPNPQTVKASRDPLPPPELFLAGVGPAFLMNDMGMPVAEYSSAMVPVQIMLESEYKYTKRHLSAVHANEIFLLQDNRRYVYALIMTECYMRAFMFDPAGCVVAPRLDYHARPAEFCAAIAGMASLDEVRAGFDTSFVLGDNSVPRISITERIPSGPSRQVSYWVKRRLFKAPKFVSRATGCWVVESVEEPGKTYVIKDAWIAPSETQNEMEGSLIAHANKQGVVCGLVRIRHQARILVPGRSEDTIIKNRRIRSGALTDGMSIVRDRVHTRIVMDTFGKPIWQFSSRKELLLAFHDAVQAHRNLYQMANILHRDVSIGNILINKDCQAEQGNRGILIDLDYAVRLEKLEKSPGPVGTRRFMSHRLLQNKQRHSHLDDLESFYYVLCWLICEYDGPGDVSTSRVQKTPQLLEEWDGKHDGVAKSKHMREDFVLPIQPWFGETIREMAMQLHGFFHYRTKFDGPEPDPEHDYEEFIGYIRNAIEKLGPQDDIEPTPKQPEVKQEEIPASCTKRKAADIDPAPEPIAKRAARAPKQHVAERPRRANAKYH